MAKPKGYSSEQITQILKQQEAGLKVAGRAPARTSVMVCINVLLILFDHDKLVSGNIGANFVALGQRFILIGKT